MNERRLRIYLDDHLALMVAEVALIGRCWWNNRRTPLGEFLQRLENEVRAQQAITKDVIHRLGGKDTLEGRLKQGAAWFAEKVGRFKLNDSLFTYSDLSRVVEVETLAAAAQERIALWDNLDAVVRHESRLDGITCSHFREQSRRQLEELQTRRRFAAVEAFVDSPPEKQATWDKRLHKPFNSSTTMQSSALEHDAYMRRAIELAHENPQAPFGSVLVDRRAGEIVASGINKSSANPTLHGEIAAMNDYAGQGKSDWDELTLYTTAEPCCMCQGAILWSGIRQVVYGTSIACLKTLGWRQIDIPATEVVARSWNPNVVVVAGVCVAECDQLFAAALSQKVSRDVSAAAQGIRPINCDSG